MTKKEYQRFRNNPAKYETWRQRQKEKRRLKRLAVLEKRKHSPYWQRKVGYDRYFRHRTFKRLASQTNSRCKNGKVTAYQLWCLAKKQKLICALTGEKLTTENISLDHKIPVSKDGTNLISNLQLVTLHANTAKNSMTNDEFYLFCQSVINRLSPTGTGGTTPHSKNLRPYGL